jgi:predicted O-methyltransferase YrrM
LSLTVKLRIAGGRAKRRLSGSIVTPRLRLQRRSRPFRNRGEDRFWWYRLAKTDYVPPVFKTLTRREWWIMSRWFEDSERAKGIGEINVPAMSLLQGLIMGNGITRTVELGHYYGYSTLLTGFMLRGMDNGAKMVSIDIDPKAHHFTRKWIERAGLTRTCSLFLGDSSDPKALEFAVEKLGGMPELILLDSSHQYEHTLRELDLWVPRMKPNTIMVLHDTSNVARDWDATEKGGVPAALEDWLPRHPEIEFINLNRAVPASEPDVLSYKDGCGIGILQIRAD